MSPLCTAMIRDQVEQLRTELADLAYVLDRRGRCDAAYVAVTISARLGEILDCVEGLVAREEAGRSPVAASARPPTPLPQERHQLCP